MQTLTFGPLKFHAIYLLHGESADALQGFTERDGDFKRAGMDRQDWAAPMPLRAWAITAGLTEAEADAIDWTTYSIEGLPVPVKNIGDGTREVMILGQWDWVEAELGVGVRPLNLLMMVKQAAHLTGTVEGLKEELKLAQERAGNFAVEITSLRQQAAAADEVVMVSTGGKAVPVEDVAAPEAEEKAEGGRQNAEVEPRRRKR